MLEVKEDDQRGAGGGKDGHARSPVGGAEVELDGQVHGGLPPAQGLAAQGGSTTPLYRPTANQNTTAAIKLAFCTQFDSDHLDWFLWKMPALWWRTRLCGPTRTRLASSRCHKSGNLARCVRCAGWATCSLGKVANNVREQVASIFGSTTYHEAGPGEHKLSLNIGICLGNKKIGFHVTFRHPSEHPSWI